MSPSSLRSVSSIFRSTDGSKDTLGKSLRESVTDTFSKSQFFSSEHLSLIECLSRLPKVRRVTALEISSNRFLPVHRYQEFGIGILRELQLNSSHPCVFSPGVNIDSQDRRFAQRETSALEVPVFYECNHRGCRFCASLCREWLLVDSIEGAKQQKRSHLLVRCRISDGATARVIQSFPSTSASVWRHFQLVEVRVLEWQIIEVASHHKPGGWARSSFFSDIASSTSMNRAFKRPLSHFPYVQ